MSAPDPVGAASFVCLFSRMTKRELKGFVDDAASLKALENAPREIADELRQVAQILALPPTAPDVVEQVVGRLQRLAEALTGRL